MYMTEEEQHLYEVAQTLINNKGETALIYSLMETMQIGTILNEWQEQYSIENVFIGNDVLFQIKVN